MSGVLFVAQTALQTAPPLTDRPSLDCDWKPHTSVVIISVVRVVVAQKRLEEQPPSLFLLSSSLSYYYLINNIIVIFHTCSLLTILNLPLFPAFRWFSQNFHKNLRKWCIIKIMSTIDEMMTAWNDTGGLLINEWKIYSNIWPSNKNSLYDIIIKYDSLIKKEMIGHS